jgi:predicted O-methyltransferase YrrM
LITIDFSKNSYDEAEKNIKEAKLENNVTQIL